MPPFVAKFCPVKFGWENALMLNAMQHIYESAWDNGFLRNGGSLIYDSDSISEYSSYHGYLLHEYFFSEVTGTVADADWLSLKSYQEIYMFSEIFKFSDSETEAIAVELEHIFTVGTKGMVLHDGDRAMTNFKVRRSIMHLRLDLIQRFFLIDPTAETDVFSPVKYGQRNALMLNCLQQVVVGQLLLDPLGLPRQSTTLSLFSRPSGTEFEADCLSLYFCCHKACIYDNVFSNENAFREAFLIDKNMNRRQAMGVIEREMFQLRVGLYSIPRFTAFLMGRHRRLGASMGVLGDDLCRMILVLSLK
jgi:hypothetical protein